MSDTKERKFELGQIVITRTAMAELTQEDIFKALARHQAGDWGDVPKADREENELSLKEGFRLMSVYFPVAEKAFWIITEADRSMTTILMPEDY